MLTKLSDDLEKMRIKIRDYAKGYGLDFFETIFVMVDFDQINSLAALGGFPKRYPHWRFGMEYDKISKSYEYGMSKIYEMVINTDPSYAYLLNSNNLVDQKLVMSHVYAHVDFFKNNYWFSKTNRKMLDQMANHSTRVRRYMDKYGVDRVEDFIDSCLSIENLIDPYLPFQAEKKKEENHSTDSNGQEDEQVYKLKVERSYMDKFINPPEFVEKQKTKSVNKIAKEKRNPEYPERDVLKFLLDNAPLEKWESDVLSIIREEAYYFVPQMMTKIMNEGWASYWHSKLMTEKVLEDSELIDYAHVCSGVFSTAPGQFNPYKLGVELYRDIEERWDKGMFGKEWDACLDVEVRKRWDRKTGIGRNKLFEVRKIYNDVNFVDEFFTEEFCIRTEFYKYMWNEQNHRYEIVTREFQQVKDQLLTMLTNGGQPVIEVIESNFKNRGELLLRHRHQGVDLDQKYSVETMKNLNAIWRRPVNLLTILEGKEKVLSCEGGNFKIEDYAGPGESS